MHINELYKRRIRIVGKTDEAHGYMLTVHDLETGEPILNVARVMIYLDPRELNIAEITYYEFNEQGKLVIKDGEPVSKTVRLYDPEIDLAAYERFNPPFRTGGVNV